MITWQYVGDPLGPEVLKIDADGKTWGVPKDPANSDYQAYLKSLENAE
jgi:hypothetical protein